MKRVALLFDGWKRFVTNEWTEGIQTYAAQMKEDVGLFQFQCWGNSSKSRRFNGGEYNIFSLPDLRKYDGIIVDATNILDEQVKKELFRRVRESDVPAVSLCMEADGMYYAGIGGRAAVSEIIHHLYDVHGCRSFFFAGGPADNYENQEREAAFHDCMKEFDIPEENQDWNSGTYDFRSGISTMRQILSSEKKLPDAIVCANDNIAVGIIMEAEKAGLKVPDNFCVTGFDCLDKASYFDPQITSADLNRTQIGSRAMEILDRCWQGEKLPKHHYVTSHCHYGESCGCPNTGLVDYRKYVRNQIEAGLNAALSDAAMASFEADLMACETLEDIASCVLREFRDLDDDGCYLAFDDRLVSPEPGSTLPEKGYDRHRLRVVRASEYDREMFFDNAAELNRYLWNSCAGSTYFILPLHMKQYAAGYMVVRNPRYIADYLNVYRIQEYILNTLQTVYANTQIRTALKRLSEIYDRDRLTGVYGRTALTEKIVPFFEEEIRAGGKVAVCFTDVDHFKKLNDTCGHDYGDRVLVRVAAVLTDRKPEDGYVCRYGGDEFLIIFPMDRAEDMENFRTEVTEDLAKQKIRISMGMVMAPDDTVGKNLDDFINAADAQMYRIKEAHHSGRS